ncbi:hypothetical protein L228DRAFT_18838 [Xylona heveae TC161]|uniref:Uncharacterized protein n=1 Tax=Xylona heveae (strain CBS 132557 / TC161) TaxID=1328760 RepID=A0A165JYQ9_XYLHT|nr:hypothetical protein L228DRAFT_18838 [Xylona heveae TC161]KZF26795.1 hypothetical protein L228DRAFT_18838 [Xylona heveae TC161]
MHAGIQRGRRKIFCVLFSASSRRGAPISRGAKAHEGHDLVFEMLLINLSIIIDPNGYPFNQFSTNLGKFNSFKLASTAFLALLVNNLMVGVLETCVYPDCGQPLP